jgi:hypothetical protein
VGGQRRLQVLKGLSLLIALSVLGIVIARLAGWMPDVDDWGFDHPSPTPLVVTTFPSTPGGVDTLVTKVLPSPLAGQSPTAVVTLIGPATPADAWANSLLDQVLGSLQQPQPPADGFAWWQNSEASGDLSLVGNVPTLGGHPLDLSEQTQIDISMPRQTNPNQVERVASIVFAQGASTLTVYNTGPSPANEHWVLSSTEPTTACNALIVQAAARAIVLRAAYIENPGGTSEIMLVSASTLSTPTAAPTDLSPTASPTLTPTQLILSATPTREPDPYLGKVIAAAIDPIIDDTQDFVPSVVLDFANRHPRTGHLMWTASGPQLGGQLMSVSQASELGFYTLSPSEQTGRVTSFLKIVFTNNTTRLPEMQIYFQGQRMEEILFWLVSRADERGGQLRIAYDDFGTRQAITVIGFDPASSSRP